MKEPANFEAFWLCWERRPTLKRFRRDFAYVACGPHATRYEPR